MSNSDIREPDDSPDAPITNEELYLAHKSLDGNSDIRDALSMALITFAGLTAAGVFSPLALAVVGGTYTVVTALRGIANNEGGFAKRVFVLDDIKSTAEIREEFEAQLEAETVADGGEVMGDD